MSIEVHYYLALIDNSRFSVQNQDVMSQEAPHVLAKAWDHRTEIGAGAVAITLLGGSLSEMATNHPTRLWTHLGGYVFDHGCDHPSKPELSQVRQDILEPLAAKDRLSPNSRIYVRKLADQYNFTLIDDSPYQRQLKKAKTAKEMASVVNSYTSNFGIKFSIKEEEDDFDSGSIKPVQIPASDIKKFRTGARRLMKDFYYMPKEVAQNSGVKKIRVTGSMSGGKTLGGAGAKYVGLTKEVAVTPGSFYYDSTITGHEFIHGLDQKSCGYWGSARDPDWKDLNAAGFQYGTTEASRSPSISENYGSVDVMEDKATTGEGLIMASAPLLIQTRNPVQLNKMALLFARFEQKFPNYSKYLVRLNKFRFSRN